MTLADFNNLDQKIAAKHLSDCCGAALWVTLLMRHFPFPTAEVLVERATKIWYESCSETDWKESFTHHPKIGDVQSLTQKFAGKEQARVAMATIETILALAQANTDYENKFGFIFIVCATGKSADQMLQLLLDRLKNSVEEELNIAMGEQHKISLIRFGKLLIQVDFTFLKGSQITTHVLDTTLGLPGKNIAIRLQSKRNNIWQTMAQGITIEDGRIHDLLPQNRTLPPDNYKMVFDTHAYFTQQNLKTFYPEVAILFTTFDESHYHIPLLLNPFGYNTYRGS